MKYFYPFAYTVLFLLCLFLTNQSTASLSKAAPDNSIDISVDKPSICEGESINISLATSETGVEYQLKADGMNTGVPLNGTGSQITFNLSPNSTATYSVTATNISTLETSDLTETLTVTVNPGPQLDLNVTATESQICESLNTPVIISVENTQNGLTYWLKDHTGSILGSQTGNNGTMNFTVSPDVTTTYTVETTMAGCSGRVDLENSYELEVISLPITNIDVSISEPEVCLGEHTIISIATSELGVNYQLFDGTYFEGEPIAGTGSELSFPEFSPFRSVYYQVVATKEVCGTTRILDESVRVDVGLQPEEHLHPTINKHTICEGEQVVVSLTPTDSKVVYQLWSDDTPIGVPVNGNGQAISFEPTTPTESTTYRIEALGERCLAPIEIRYTVDVTVHHQPETNKTLIGDRDTVCVGEEVLISVENSQADMVYQLFDGSNFIEPSVVGNGATIQFPVQYPNTTKTYSVQVSGMVCNNSVMLDNSKLITVPDINTNSVENFATPEEFCEGESIDIELTGSIEGIQYVLQDGENILAEVTGNGEPIVFEDIVPGINSQLQVTIGNCKDKLIAATPNYTVQSNPKLQIATGDVQSGYNGNLVISVSGGTAPYTYIVDPGETITKSDNILELSGIEAGTYQILVIDSNTCRSSDEGQLVEVKIDDNLKVIVNNALTPNGDGINDEWIIHYDASLGNPEVYIFNIYGQQIYHSKVYQNDWKGSFNGSTLPNGAYYYLIEFESEDIKPIKGSLSILGN